MKTLYIDADACPVKNECYRVAGRYQWDVWVVANTWIQTPRSPKINAVVVGQGEDVADDWIAERAEPGDIVITSDIPLASRSLERGALVLGPRGKPFTSDNIGDALAGRELGKSLREMGVMTGGPKPMDKAARGRFLSALDAMVHKAQRVVPKG